MSSSGFEEFWYQAKENVHEHLFAHVRGIEENQKHVHEANLLHAKLYSNRELLGVDWGTQVRRSGRTLGPVSENVIQSVIDTATALIAKARPKPTIVTDGAEWSLQRRAKQLDKVLYAEFRRIGVYEKGTDVFRDSCWAGTGFLKFFVDDNNKVSAERLMPDEVIVDERECISEPPREIHHRRPVDMEVLKSMYPEQANLIDEAQSTEDYKYTTYRSCENGQVVLVESWRLPEGEEKGRHVVCVDSCTLEDEEWDREEFPIVVLRWSKPIAGFYGQGLSEQLAGLQLRINKLNKFIDRVQELVAVPRFLVPHGSRVKDSHITNAPGSIIHYTGPKPPTVWVGQAVSQEVFQRLESLKRSAFEFAGISQLSAQSKKPAGLESGVALREYSDLETARFSIQSQMLEMFYLECGMHIIKLLKSIGNKGYSVNTWKSHNTLEKINWKDVDMEDDRFVIKIEASSILSKTPAGRKSDVVDLMAMGALSPEDAPRLLGHPDLDRYRDLEDADHREAEAVVEALMNGSADSPDPLQNLPLTMSYVQRTYLKIKREGAPEDVLELFRAWIARAQDMLKMMQPPPMPVEEPAPKAKQGA